jgi:hypothetical protein
MTATGLKVAILPQRQQFFLDFLVNTFFFLLTSGQHHQYLISSWIKTLFSLISLIHIVE